MSKPKQHRPIFGADGSVINPPKPSQGSPGNPGVPFKKGGTILGKFKDHTEIPKIPKVMLMALIKGDMQGVQFDVNTGKWQTMMLRNAGVGEKQWIGLMMTEEQTRTLLEKDREMPVDLVEELLAPIDPSNWLPSRDKSSD